MLASIGQLEFFYDQAPDVMRSCSMALQLLSVCIGSYLSGALVLGVAHGTAAAGAAGGAGWLPANLNDGRLDLFFLLLAGARPAQAARGGARSRDHEGSARSAARAALAAEALCSDVTVTTAAVRCVLLPVTGSPGVCKPAPRLCTVWRTCRQSRIGGRVRL